MTFAESSSLESSRGHKGAVEVVHCDAVLAGHVELDVGDDETVEGVVDLVAQG